MGAQGSAGHGGDNPSETPQGFRSLDVGAFNWPFVRYAAGYPNNTRTAGREAEMLVLTRKSNQSIMIGDDIEVSVLSIMGEKVRIGIQAPRDIPVFRKEVYLEIQQENVAAGTSARAEVDAALNKLKS
jgi:carbon storage regulator